MTRILRIFVSGDGAAKALGADRVAEAFAREMAARGIEAPLIRPGSRGLVYLEPLVEVETDQGRIAYGPVSARDVAALLDGRLESHGLTEKIEALASQTRMTFARCGRIDPLDLAAYEAEGGWRGLEKAMALDPESVVAEMTASGLRGRGGAGFPAGIKWETVRKAEGGQKYIVCNADEGDSGTFADRMLMEGDPFTLIEGMAIAARAVGAGKGYIYLRSEYPDAIRVMREAIGHVRSAGILDRAGLAFDIELRVGAGAYVCGEETALLNSLEGKRGIVRAKPPLPALAGLFGSPTVVNNVLTLAAAPAILADGAESYAGLGAGRSRGTVPVQLSGNVRRGGLYELPFGVTLGALVDEIGGGTASGRPVRAVQVGGPLGAYFGPGDFDLPFTYEDFDAAGGLIGHAGIVVFDDTVDMLKMARFAMEFCAVESCGKCTPCRIGAVRGVETLDRIAAGDEEAVTLLTDLCATMRAGSLCALGGFTPYPVLSALERFPEDFTRRREAAE